MVSKKGIIVVMVMLAAMGIMQGCINKQSNYIETASIKDYVINNNENLEKFVKQLYAAQDSSFSIYAKKGEIPSGISTVEIYSRFNIQEIVVEKEDGKEKRKCVWIYLNNKPEDERYYRCGMYYSFDGVTLDCFGGVHDEDVYEYDGVPDGHKERFKSEKICDKWYFFEDAFWN